MSIHRLHTAHERVCTKKREYLPVAELKFMEAQCLIAGGEPGAAISALESILQFARTTEMNATLGRVYETSGLKRCAFLRNKKSIAGC